MFSRQSSRVGAKCSSSGLIAASIVWVAVDVVYIGMFLFKNLFKRDKAEKLEVPVVTAR